MLTQRQARRQKLATKGRTSKSDTVTKGQVRTMIRSELATVVEEKVTYTTQAGGIDYSGSTFNLVAGITRGDNAVDNYTGNILRPHEVWIRGCVDTGQTFSNMRLILFQFGDASNPAASGIFQTVASALAPYSGVNWVNHHKIRVLADELITLFPVAGSYAARSFCLHVKGGMRNIQMSTGGGATPQMDGLYLAAVSDDGAPLYPQLNFISEIRFTDA